MVPTLSSRPRRRHVASRARQRGFWQWAIPAAVGALGLLSGRNAAKAAEEGQRETNLTNLEIAQRQMDFQEEMSGTAYQRAVLDMQRAGLNPMLAYSQGGASAPQGAAIPVQNPRAQSSQIMAQATMNSAQSAAQLVGAYNQAELAQAQARNQDAQAAQTIASTLSPSVYQAQGYSTLAKTNEEGNKLATSANVDQEMVRRIVAEITGVDADSKSKEAMFKEMHARGGFAADVERRKAESQSAGLETILRQYGLAEAKSTSDFFNKAETLPRWLRLILQTLQTTMGAGRVLGR